GRGRDEDIHSAWVSLSRGRPDGDQLSPAPLDVDHARRGVRRVRADDAGVPGSGRRAIPVLFLRRRDGDHLASLHSTRDPASLSGFGFTIDHERGAARAGVFRTPHGPVDTPAFMAVGTLATVKALDPDDLRALGAQMILGNAYHLHLRPGDEVVRELGGLHAFMAWDGPILTDSGGFQVFSLEGLRTVSEDGVEFRSHLDGSLRAFTPESVMRIERNLGADVIMQFDHVIPGQSDEATARDASERSLRWLTRCAAALAPLPPYPQALFPIVQGGIH